MNAYDFILRIAEAAGIAYYAETGQEHASIPVESHKLNKCKRVFNDAVNMFIATAPTNGWRWIRRIAEIVLTDTQVTGTADSTSTTTLVDATLSDTYDTDDDLKDYYIYITGGTGKGSYAKITGYTAESGTCTVADWLDENGNPGGTDPVADDSYSITPIPTVCGDKARYLLPADYGSARGKVTYKEDSNHAYKIEWTDESVIRANRSTTIDEGYPNMAAVRPYGFKRKELLVDPSPNAEETILLPYSIGFSGISIEGGLATSGSATTLVNSNIADKFPDGYFNGWTIRIHHGTGINSYAVVTDYTGNSGTFTVADWLAIDGSAGGKDPAANSAYYVEPIDNNHPAGSEFDSAILSACLAQTELQFENINKGYAGKFYNVDIVKAWDMDTRHAPQKIAQTPKTVERIRGTITYNG